MVLAMEAMVIVMEATAVVMVATIPMEVTEGHMEEDQLITGNSLS